MCSGEAGARKYFVAFSSGLKRNEIFTHKASMETVAPLPCVFKDFCLKIFGSFALIINCAPCALKLPEGLSSIAIPL